MGGNKGTTTTNQQQTYNPAGYSYVQNALDRSQQTANLPFNIPQAPVAGFSNDQQSAFNSVNGAQGMAMPYINQASNYFNQGTQPNVSQFFNPYASAVTDNLKDIFGQQMTDTTGQLTKNAGGTGADRIAVGQSELAKQQGLAAGQTLSSLYQPALGAAMQQEGVLQNAGYGMAGLGSAAQNSVLQGANAQLGTGGLQQQLSQAQMNAPYQWQLAQSAFPYQQSQFLNSAVGSLAPGLGGTTSGQGTTQGPAPSIWSQILGAGTAAAGAYGAYSGSGGGTGGTGKGATSMNGQLTTPQSVPGYVSAARGGVIPGYAEGGDTEGSNPFALANNVPVSGAPINIDSQSIIPQSQAVPIQPHIPQIDLNPKTSTPAAASGPSVGDIAKIAMMFAARGGTVNPFADGGSVFTTRFPKGYAEGSDVPFPIFGEDGKMKGNITDPGQEPAPQAPSDLPGMTSMRFAGTDDAPQVTGFPPLQQPAKIAAGDTPPASTVSDREVTPPATKPAADPAAIPEIAGLRSKESAASNPWMALMQAGLGMMGGTSPYAGVNIGKGAQEGLKVLQQQRESDQKDTTIAQSAKRLEMEAKHHEDTYNRTTPMQKAQIEHIKSSDELADEMFRAPYEKLTRMQQEQVDEKRRSEVFAREQFNRPYNELTANEKAQLKERTRQFDQGRINQDYQPKADGSPGWEPVPGGPADPVVMKAQAEAKRLPAMSEETMKPMVESYVAGNTGVLSQVGRGTQGAVNLEQFWRLVSDNLKASGKSGNDLAAARANFMAQSAALRTAATRESNITTAVNEANGTFPEVERTSKLLDRSTFIPFNKAMEYYRTQTGSPEQRQYGAAIQAAVTAYSQAMSRTGVNSVYAQQHAADILSKVDGHDAMMSSIKQLKTEMQIAKAAPDETRRDILDHIIFPNGKPRGVTSAVTDPAAAGLVPATVNGSEPAKPKPAQKDIDYVKAHPEVRDQFIQRFGVEP